MQLKKILVVSPSDDDLYRLQDQLRDESDWQLTLLRVTEALNGDLRRAFSTTDIALVCCRSGQVSLLEAIDALPETTRPRILVCGDLSSPEATRLLVRIGVVDLLPSTPTTPELRSAVRRALRDGGTTERFEHPAKVISVFDASGGADSVLIAGTLAHLLSENSKRTLLIDLDLIYSPLSSMFGLRPSRGIFEAVHQIENLDAMALDGYVVKHKSGLSLLSSVVTSTLPPVLPAVEFSRLLALCRQHHDFVFISGNRSLDPASVEAATASHHVLVSLGQSLAEVRLATRLHHLLTQSVGVPESAMRIILNRYSTHSLVKDDMISKALGAPIFAKIPSDGPLVRRSIDSGTPLADLDRHSPLTEAFVELEGRLTGLTPPPPISPVRRMLATLVRSER
jgi:pilus assembly protein CpaE